MRLGLEEPGQPLATIEEHGPAQILRALTSEASAAGLHPGQPLREALALCPGLRTRQRQPMVEANFMAVLRRWSGRYSPLVALDGTAGLLLDITGCAHLFGGEEGMFARVIDDFAEMGLSLRAGIADTPGAAWALAHHSGRDAASGRSGDGISSEARATRSRAARRPQPPRAAMGQGGIAPSGHTHDALAPLPMEALRLSAKTAESLSRLGLRRIGDLYAQPRAALARRFGTELVLRLDQALGAVPEPISPVRHEIPYATRLSLPDPIGLMDDLLAGLDRLLPRLCTTLARDGLGARVLRFEAYRADGGFDAVTIALARPMVEPERIRPLLMLKLTEIDAGFGIDMLRLVTLRAEPLRAQPVTSAIGAPNTDDSAALHDLLGRLGARLGTDAVTRRHPANSHIPEKTALTLAAAWSDPCGPWPERPERPILTWRPEPVQAPARPVPPARFRWRRREHVIADALGPERILPEWWLEDPQWRSGARDYWIITTETGERLWLFYAHGAALSAGWFCVGNFL